LSRPAAEHAADVGASSVWRDVWFPIAFARDFEVGRVERVELLGRALALFLDERGQPAALIDRCPHRSARLSDGRVRDGSLECLYHGWRFDARGRCVEAPQQPADTPLPSHGCAQAVPLRVEQGLVWAWAGAAGRESEHIPHTIPALDRAGVRSVDFAMDLPYGQDYFIENVLDVAHIHVAHSGTRGGGDRRLAGPLEFSFEHEGPEGFAATFRTLGLTHAPRTPGLRRAYVEFRAPNLVHFVSEFEDPSKVSGLALYSMPSAAGACRMLYRAYGTLWSEQDLRRPRWREHLGQCFLLEEDMAVVRGQAEEIDSSREPLAQMWHPLRTSDPLVLRYREWVERHAAQRPGAVGLRNVGERGVLAQQARLDRWTLHTRHCADCRAAHAGFKRRAKHSNTLSFAALAGGVALGAPWAWGAAALAAGLHFIARRAQRTAREFEYERDLRGASQPES
jgi:phenylpropionate dioxygenase-like ring-hydroxylating dioxygenase large terminal subunit